MSRVCDWLSRHRFAASAIAVVYTAAVTIGHDVGQAIAGWLMRLFTTDRTIAMITIGGVMGTVVLAGRAHAVLLGRPDRRTLAAFGLLTLALALLGYNFLFVINTEVAHYPQYALLSMVLLPVIRHYGETVVLATLLATVDEGYHYWVLNDYWPYGYLDFNDIVLNQIGAAIGVVLLATFLRPGADEAAPYRWGDFLRSPAFVMAAGVTAAALGLYAFGRMTTYAEPSSWVFLRKTPAGDYWYFSNFGKTCHYLLPGEGLLVLWLLVLPYVELDRRLPFGARGDCA